MARPRSRDGGGRCSSSRLQSAVELRLRENKRQRSFTKCALAVFRMSLARRSSSTSRSISLIRCASEVVVPTRRPLSTSAFLTHSLRACGTQSILGQSIQWLHTERDSRLGAPAPCARRACGPRVRTCLTWSWLHLLRRWSLLNSLGGSRSIFVQM